MIAKEQIEEFLKSANIPDNVKGVFGELLEGYNEALELCESQAAELETKEATIEKLQQQNEVTLQKVASENFTKTAGAIADELVAQQIIAAESRDEMAETLSADPTKTASVVRNVFTHVIPSTEAGFGEDPPSTKRASEDEDPNLIPADDPFMLVIKEGA